MNRNVVLGIGAAWVVAVLLTAVWVVFARGKGAPMMQVLLVGVLPLLVALLISNRLAPLARATGPSTKGKAQPPSAREARGVGRAVPRRGGGRLTLLRGRRAAEPDDQAQERPPAPAVATALAVAPGPGAGAPAAEAQPAPPRSPVPPVAPGAARLSNPPPDPREPLAGQDAVARIRAMQREVEELRSRLEGELSNLGTLRGTVGPEAGSRTRVFDELRQFLVNAKAQKELLVEEAEKVRRTVLEAFESARGMLEEVDAIVQAAKGEMAQVEAVERYLGGGAELAPPREAGALRPAAPPEPLQGVTKTDVAAAAGRLAVSATGAGEEAKTPGAAPGGLEEERTRVEVSGRQGRVQETGRAGAGTEREVPAAEPSTGLVGQPGAARREPAQMEAEESLESALQKALGGTLREEPSEAPAATGTRRSEPPPQRESSTLERELSAALGSWTGLDQGAAAKEVAAPARGDGVSLTERPQPSATDDGSPLMGTFYITVKPLVGGAAYGRFWTLLEKVVGVGKVVDSAPLRDQRALRLTVDLGHEQVTMGQLTSGVPGVEFRRVDEQNLEVTISER